MEQPLSTACPFCGSTDVERISAWGGQIITCQMRCLSCASYFEALRDDFEARVAAVAPAAEEVNGDSVPRGGTESPFTVDRADRTEAS